MSLLGINTICEYPNSLAGDIVLLSDSGKRGLQESDRGSPKRKFQIRPKGNLFQLYHVVSPPTYLSTQWPVFLRCTPDLYCTFSVLYGHYYAFPVQLICQGPQYVRYWKARQGGHQRTGRRGEKGGKGKLATVDVI